MSFTKELARIIVCTGSHIMTCDMPYIFSKMCVDDRCEESDSDWEEDEDENFKSMEVKMHKSRRVRSEVLPVQDGVGMETA